MIRRWRKPPRRWEQGEQRPRLATVLALTEDGQGRPVARVAGPDGVAFDLQPIGGWLPAEGDTVVLAANGGDVLSQAARRLVEGDVTSSGGWDPDATASWGLDADGHFRAKSGWFQGEVTASTVTGSVIRSAATGERLEISEAGGIWALRFFNAAGQERARLTTTDHETISMSLVGSGPPSSIALSRAGGDAWALVDADVIGVEATQSLALAAPVIYGSGRVEMDLPLAVVRRTSAQGPIPTGSWTALTPNATDVAHKVTLSSALSPDEPGWYRVSTSIRLTGGPVSEYAAGAGIARNGATSLGADLWAGDMSTVHTGVIAATKSATAVFELNGTSDYVRPCIYLSGADVNAQLMQISVEKIRGPV